ncbi:MAG: helix-hairpin-helix domain-containing protein [Candidatus Thorarchaeota archaeon]
METKQKIIANVRSPSKDANIREGTGFSLSEIKQAGRDLNILKKMNIKIDYFRKSTHPENIEKLKSIEIPKKKGKKKDPFVKKEKKRTEFKPKKEKKIVKKPVKPAQKPKKKEKIKPIKAEKLEKVPKPAGIPLTELSGLGAATAKKFIELGVNNVEDLIKENPDELASLIKGVSLDRLMKWIEEGKALIK